MKGKYLSRWEPFNNLLSLRSDFDRLFDSFFGRWPARLDDLWAPVVDIEEKDGKITLNAELPGLKKEDINVSVRNNTVTISGERKHEEETKEKTFHRIERSYGKFERCIQLPTDVDADKVTAAYKDGVLSVTLQKPESLKSKEIEVE